MQRFNAAAILAASVLVLTGCSGTTNDSADDGLLRVTASTNVYGSLVEQIGGERVDVTTIIDSAAHDPHSYEATARDRLAVQGADLVVENGGGYDAFIDTLLEGSDAHVFTAVEFSHDYPGNAGHGAEAEAEVEAEGVEGEEGEEGHDHAHADDHAHSDEGEHDHAEDGDHEDHEGHEGHDHIAGFNEHVWFDPHTMIHVVAGLAEELSELDPEGAADFTANADEIIADLEAAEAELETIKAEANGAGAFITEPLPGYIAASAGLSDLAPEGFAAAVEEGRDVAPATILESLKIIEGGEVKVVLTNAQTGGGETERIEEAATTAGIPIVAFTELLEDGSSYSEWMHDAIQSLADALRS